MGKAMSDALRKLFFALTQLPLFAGLAVRWDQVQPRPVVAALICVGYEILIFAVAFGKKVWAQLEPDIVKIAASWVKAFVSSLKPGFHRRYNQQIINEHGIFNVRGLGLIN